MKKDMKEMGILLISHDIPALEELGSQLFILSNGKIVDNGKIPMIFEESKEFFEKESVDKSKMCSLGEWQWKDY
jgi:ABC-type microcin C transport system duplicated ATPase subunit YejF